MSEYIYEWNLIGSSLKITPNKIHHTMGYIHSPFVAIIRRLYIDRAIGIIIRELVLVSIALKHICKKMDNTSFSLYIKHRMMYYVL